MTGLRDTLVGVGFAWHKALNADTIPDAKITAVAYAELRSE